MPTLAPRPLKLCWIEPTGMDAVFLRVYVPYGGCPANMEETCEAMVFIGDFKPEIVHLFEQSDACWPTSCDSCHRPFTEVRPHRQVFKDGIYRGPAGEQRRFREWIKMPGVLFDATWLADAEAYRGPDGRSLIAICPDGHEWTIDGPATNCTKKGDTKHKCWTRNTDLAHLDVSKNYGPTCEAGGGSIQTENWHGFLRNGYFVDV